MEHTSIELDPQDLRAAAQQIPAGVPVTMINLIAFHAQAQYVDSSFGPCSGQEAYLQRYAPAFNQVAAHLGIEGIQLLHVGAVAPTLVGPAEPKWDLVAVVRYPNFAALQSIVESDLYAQTADPHRRAALKAWTFLASFQPPA